MLTLATLQAKPGSDRALQRELGFHDLRLAVHAPGATLPGSYWGEPEAGIVADVIHARPDTPVHSVLHEACHLICMGPKRRRTAHCDAGGDDLEESAVCFLQLVIAERLPGVGWRRLAADMDAWGYSFRVGSTAQWFCTDAGDARAWLAVCGLLVPNRDRHAISC